MLKKGKTRRMINISESLEKLIKMRGGNDYVIHCLKTVILSHEMPSIYEIEQATGMDVYEQIALHKGNNEWYDKLFPEGDPLDEKK